MIGLAVGLTSACSTTARQPPGAPPTPISVTSETPGGDADDPVQAALTRLLDERWGVRQDKFKTLNVRLPDQDHWRRVRILGQPTRAAFRYGDEHHAVDVVFYTDAEGSDTPRDCLEHFLAEAEETAMAYGSDLRVGAVEEHEHEVHGEPRSWLLVRGEGTFRSFLGSEDYVGALAVYQSWPGTCLVQGYVVKSTEHHGLAVQVRERWVEDAADRLRWKHQIDEAPPRSTR